MERKKKKEKRVTPKEQYESTEKSTTAKASPSSREYDCERTIEGRERSANLQVVTGEDQMTDAQRSMSHAPQQLGAVLRALLNCCLSVHTLERIAFFFADLDVHCGGSAVCVPTCVRECVLWWVTLLGT
jgi:hypothetical protein